MDWGFFWGGGDYLSCLLELMGDVCDGLVLLLLCLKELEKATRAFTLERLLGKGSHGWVYKGILEDGKVVAVKRPTYARQLLQDETSFDNELEILSKLWGEHVVNLLGYSCDTNEKLLVVEFMANGSLHDSLHNKVTPLNWFMRVQLALQTAKGILSLHSASPPIIHRDIKSSNVMIDEKWNAKLGDFGLALRGHIEDVLKMSTPPAGTMGYLDPEYETPSDLSTKTDVFSFGILLLEIVSGRHAIDLACEPPSILDWAVPLVKEGSYIEVCDKKLSLPANFKPLKQLMNLAVKCVRASSENPPHMFDVVEDLKEISRRISLTTFNGLSRVVQRNIGAQRSRPPGISARRLYRGPSQDEDKAMHSKLTNFEKEAAVVVVESCSAQVLATEVTALDELPPHSSGFFTSDKALSNPLTPDGSEVESEMPFEECTSSANASFRSTHVVTIVDLDDDMREHTSASRSSAGQCTSQTSSRFWIGIDGASQRPLSPCASPKALSVGGQQHVYEDHGGVGNFARRLTSSRKNPLFELSATPIMPCSSLYDLARGPKTLSSSLMVVDRCRLHADGFTPKELHQDLNCPKVLDPTIPERRSLSSASGAAKLGVSDTQDSRSVQMQDSQLESWNQIQICRISGGNGMPCDETSLGLNDNDAGPVRRTAFVALKSIASNCLGGALRPCVF